LVSVWSRRPSAVIERGGQRQPDAETFLDGQTAATMQLKLERARCVALRMEDRGRRRANRKPGVGAFLLPRSFLLPAQVRRVIRQFHHIVEVPGGVTAADVEHVQLAVVGAGNRLEPPDPLPLLFVRPVVLESPAVDDLHGAELTEDVSRQPDFAVAAASNAAQHFVVGDAWSHSVGSAEVRGTTSLWPMSVRVGISR
jgi:hypothetical protein